MYYTMNCSSNDKNRDSSFFGAHTCFALEPARNTCANSHLLPDSTRQHRKDEMDELARLRTLPARQIGSMTSVLATIALLLLMSTHGSHGQVARWYHFPGMFSMNSFGSIDVMPSKSAVKDSSEDSSSMDAYSYGVAHSRVRSSEEVDDIEDMYDRGTHETTEEESEEKGSHLTLDEIERVVQRAMKEGTLLDPRQWAEHNNVQKNKKNLPRDTSRQRSDESSPRNDRRESSYTEKKIAQPTRSSESVQSDGKIVFPDDQEDNRSPPTKLKNRTVPICKDTTFCEAPSYYPEDVISNALQKDDTLRYLAAVDVVTDVVQRIDVTDDVPLCVSNEQVVYPKTAENRNKEWQFIVNQGDFTQGVRIETCANEEAQCRMYDNLPAGYRSSCKQKYIYRQLAAVRDGSVVPEMFRFPSSCCCHVKFVGNPLGRMGFSAGEEQTPAIRNGKNE